jgi:hypothetical protein
MTFWTGIMKRKTDTPATLAQQCHCDHPREAHGIHHPYPCLRTDCECAVFYRPPVNLTCIDCDANYEEQHAPTCAALRTKTAYYKEGPPVDIAQAVVDRAYRKPCPKPMPVLDNKGTDRPLTEAMLLKAIEECKGQSIPELPTGYLVPDWWPTLERWAKMIEAGEWPSKPEGQSQPLKPDCECGHTYKDHVAFDVFAFNAVWHCQTACGCRAYTRPVKRGEPAPRKIAGVTVTIEEGRFVAAYQHELKSIPPSKDVAQRIPERVLDQAVCRFVGSQASVRTLLRAIARQEERLSP